MDGACTFLYFFFWKNLPIKRSHYIFATAIIQNTFHFFIILVTINIMKKTKLIALLMAIMPFQSVCVNATPEVIPLDVTYDDPTNNQGPPPKDPVIIPKVSIEDYTLYFTTPCYGCTLRLVDEDDNVVYTTIITSDTLVLPSTLSGTYTMQIVQGFYCFYGDITL